MLTMRLFFAERGVRFITDIWGVQHDVSPGAEPLMILTEGQYKGYSYFNKTGTIADWEEYWYQFKKYNHCLVLPSGTSMPIRSRL